MNPNKIEITKTGEDGYPLDARMPKCDSRLMPVILHEVLCG